MFGIDGMEFLVIILVAVIVIGPKDMPEMLRAFAKTAARIRAYAQEFRGHFDEVVRRADMQETVDSLKDIGNSVQGLSPRRKLQEFYASLAQETAQAAPPLPQQEILPQRDQQKKTGAESADNAAAVLPEAEAKAAREGLAPLGALGEAEELLALRVTDSAARRAVEGAAAPAYKRGSAVPAAEAGAARHPLAAYGRAAAKDEGGAESAPAAGQAAAGQSFAARLLSGEK